MNKLFIAVLIGMLVFTACDEDTNNVGNETEIKTSAQSQDNMVNLSEINISSIKIKDLNTNEETILIKDGIVREFCGFLTELNYSKTDYPYVMGYEAEIFNSGEPILKISLGDSAVSFSEKVMLGNTVIEKGSYGVEEWIAQYIQHFYEGMVLDPQYIEVSTNIATPDEISLMEMIDRGSTKINQYEVYSKLYDFAKENFCSRKFEVLGCKTISDFEAMGQQRQVAIKNHRTMMIVNPEDYMKIDSAADYDELISASNIILVEDVQKPRIYQLYTQTMIIDIKVDDKFVKGFQDVFNTNTEVLNVLTPSEIEELINEEKPYCWDYIWKNLDIESWYGNESIRLESIQMNLSNQGEPYTVLGFYNYDAALRLLFFKEDKYIDYIDFGGKMAGPEYRLEKAGDKVFVVGKSCRGYGTGMGRYFEDWYTLTDEGKKLVVSLPYDDFVQGPLGGYNLKAKSIKLSANGDISLTADYNLKKFYLMGIDIGDENCEVTVELAKKVIFKWDNEKSVFVSEFAPNDMGMTEIPPEGEDIKQKCTDILKKKYQQLKEAMLLLDEEKYEDRKENMKCSWELFLNDCEDCDEKSALLEMLDEKH